MNRNSFIFPALLFVFWIVLVCIVNPFGNFPLNDDWQYARPVWFLINKGYYFSTDLYSPILMAQVLWGTLFCLPGGFSFVALRFSTLALSLPIIIVLYFLLLKLCKNPKLSFLGSLLVCANPLFMGLSNSFMTDVPFLASALFSIYFFLSSIETNKRWHIIAGTLFAMIAALIRQYAVVIPVAYFLAILLKKRPKYIQSLSYLLPALITLITLKIGLFWLKHIGSELKPYDGAGVWDFLKQPDIIYANLLERGSDILYYSGFFLLPLLVFTTRKALRQMSKRQKIVIVVFILFIAPVLISARLNLPCGNVLTTYGFGPNTLKGLADLVHPNPDFPMALLRLIKAIAFIGAIMLLINLGKIIMDVIQAIISKDFTKTTYKQIFILFFFLGYASLLFIPNFFYDRYILIFIPLTSILLLGEINETIKIKSVAYTIYCTVTLIMGVAGSFMVHDYFSWNRCRWEAADYLTEGLKISPRKIDGGYEFNGWVLDGDFSKSPAIPGRSRWCLNDDEYVVAFHNFDGYTVIKQYPYQNYIPYEMKNIYVLHRK
jgi:hypothetical protein